MSKKEIINIALHIMFLLGGMYVMYKALWFVPTWNRAIESMWAEKSAKSNK